MPKQLRPCLGRLGLVGHDVRQRRLNDPTRMIRFLGKPAGSALGHGSTQLWSVEVSTGITIIACEGSCRRATRKLT